MFKLRSITAPSAVLAALTLAAAPALAQERYHGRQNPSGQQSSGQSRERAQPRSETPREQPGAAAPRGESRQQTPRAQQPPQQQQAPPPQQPQRQAAQPRVENRPNGERWNDNRGNNRSYDNRAYDGRHDDRRGGEVGRAVPRGNVYAPHYEPRYSPRYSGPRYAPRYSSPRLYLSSPRYYASRSYYRPYVYRPRFSIGFGIFAGFPVPYTYSYSAPVFVYGYRAPRERVFITPGSSYYGGVALEMTPYDADVFVDGEYAGRVEDFDGYEQPLTLMPGQHSIEVQAPGYEPLVFNVEVQPGQVIPYRGDLRPY